MTKGPPSIGGPLYFILHDRLLCRHLISFGYCSCLTKTVWSLHSGHFFGLQRPSFSYSHSSQFQIAIQSSSHLKTIKVLFRPVSAKLSGPLDKGTVITEVFSVIRHNIAVMTDIPGVIRSGSNFLMQTFFLQLAEMQVMGCRGGTFFIDRF